MSLATERIERERFREMYAGQKPHFELLDGEAVQKPLPTRLHSILQFVLAVMLKELGFKARTELTLAIDESWEPVPDLTGIVGPESEEPYPTRPVAVAIEILSPDDRFLQVIQKCRKYAVWGIADILVFDPASRVAWHWDADSLTDNLTQIQESYLFRSRAVRLILAEVFRRMDEELKD
jgi:Uma2 family endonuclease